MTFTPFDEQLTAERTPLFTLSSINNLSPLRNILTGTPSHTGEEYLLNSGDKIETADVASYVPGFAAEAGIGIRVGTLPTGSQVLRWGLYDDEDGFGWKLDADGLSTFVRRNSVDTETAQSDWNVNPLDGTIVPTSSAPFDFSPTQGNIFQIRFTWYGYGQVTWSVVDTTGTDAPQTIVNAHRFAPDSATSIRNPNLPITAENTGTGDGTLYLAGRQVSIVGRYAPQRRTSSVTRTLTSIGTTWTPVIAFRRQNNTNAARTRMLVEGFSLKGTADCQVAIALNPTVTFGTAVTPDLTTTGQSAVEFSVNPSSFSIGDGQAIVTDLIPTSGTGGNAAGSARQDGLNIPVARRQPAVLLVRALTGTVDVTALLRTLEEW